MDIVLLVLQLDAPLSLIFATIDAIDCLAKGT
jgi:hypothetical protein